MSTTQKKQENKTVRQTAVFLNKSKKAHLAKKRLWLLTNVSKGPANLIVCIIDVMCLQANLKKNSRDDNFRGLFLKRWSCLVNCEKYISTATSPQVYRYGPVWILRCVEVSHVITPRLCKWVFFLKFEYCAFCGPNGLFVKLDHFLKDRVKTQDVWNHHLVRYTIPIGPILFLRQMLKQLV